MLFMRELCLYSFDSATVKCQVLYNSNSMVWKIMVVINFIQANSSEFCWWLKVIALHLHHDYQASLHFTALSSNFY